MVLKIAGEVKHIRHQFLAGDAVLGKLLVFEQLFLEPAAIYISPLNAVADDFHPVSDRNGTGVFAVAPPHVVHIVNRSIGGNLQLRIQSLQFLDLIEHREDATYNNGGTRVNLCVSGKHLREILHHSAGYALMLLGTNIAQFTDTPSRCVAHFTQLREQCFTRFGEHSITLGFLHFFHRTTIGTLLRCPPAAVTAVVVDIERFISGRCRGKRGQCLARIRVIIVIAGAAVLVD